MNPYISNELLAAQQEYDPDSNEEFENKQQERHAALKKRLAEKQAQRKARLLRRHQDNNRNYRNVWNSWMSSDEDETTRPTQPVWQGPVRQLKGNEDNTEKLVTSFLRAFRIVFKRDIPRCVNLICFQFLFEPTNVVFKHFDEKIRHYVEINDGGKLVRISSKTAFLFSDDGYRSGHHVWHVKCHQVYNCQALGICEYRNPRYQYGDNIFDVSLNQQLGDRYVFAGDQGSSWHGSSEQRPYVLCVYDNEEYYHRMIRSKLQNNRWQPGDIITVDLRLGSDRDVDDDDDGRQEQRTIRFLKNGKALCEPFIITVDLRLGSDRDNADEEQRTIRFLKNGKALCEPIQVVKRCVYYPVFQVYQRATFEIIDDISKEEIYQPEDEEQDSVEEDVDDDVKSPKDAAVLSASSLGALPDIIRHKSLDSDDDSVEE
eukprot:CAMPEP_0202730028 /NCGR_PEP_ID=MMETSP1385-20130828/186433_1 /ASSEMBLY_ACC=CAM_ASM_000861 /TAXON_ID=933848 /ORGANISM="Elphidium margaritaceum" /LENGTH=428 /DNA_ID=CAMNT_0049396301 /DNA_START=59 /DNA_END=1346 /DNA_ORIENTATION=-